MRLNRSDATHTTWVCTRRHKIAVRQAAGAGGDRTPVLVLHGMAVCSRYLVPTLTRMSASRRVVAPELPGFGRSPNPGPPLSVEESAEVLRVVATALTGPAIVVGHSAGCQATAELAFRHPRLVRCLVLVSPPPGPRNPVTVITRWLRAMAKDPLPLAMETLRDGTRAGPRTVWSAFRNLLDYRLSSTLPNVRCPVLVVRGTNDPLVSTARARHLAETAAQGHYVEIPGRHALPYTSSDDLARVIAGIGRSAEDRAQQ